MFGVGGVGLSIVQMAKALGASQIIAVDLDDQKLSLASANGATATVNGKVGDPVEGVRDLTDGGVDVAFEAIGLPLTWTQGVESLRDGGRLVAVGIGSIGSSAPVEITGVVRRSLSVIGSYGARVREDMPEVIALADRGTIDPAKMITARFPLEEAATAYRALDEGAILGRAVVVNE